MSYGAYTVQTVSEAVAVANAFTDGQAGPRRLGEILHLYGLDEDEVAAADFEGLARRIRRIFHAADPAARIEQLNRMLDEFQPSPRIVEHDGQAPHFHYVTAQGPIVDHVGASFAMALANAVVDLGAERFGRCAAPTCERVFVDTSRAGRQRFCSKTCATRVHVAAHRARA